MKTIPTITLLASLVLSASAIAAPGTRVDLSIRESVRDGASQTRVERIWITEDRVRVEDGDHVRIYDAGTGRYLAGDRATRTWYAQSGHELSAAGMVSPDAFIGIAVDAENGGARVPATAFRPTGRTHGWNDRDATEFVTTEPDVDRFVDHLWVAPQPIAWSAMLRVIRAVYCERGCALESWYDQAEAMRGWPVRIQRIADDGTETTTVTAIETVDVPDATFAMPSGWRKVDDPAGLASAD